MPPDEKSGGIFCLFGFDGPAHFGGAGTGVLETFLGGGTDDILCHLAVDTVALMLTEGLFDQPVLTGVEGEMKVRTTMSTCPMAE